MSLPLTGSQTVGPFFAIGLDRLVTHAVPTATEAAPLLHVEGRVLDGEGVPVPDAFLELWQADSGGRYDPVHGFARVPTSPEGRFHFTTHRPGPVPYDGERLQAPHLLVLVFMRGLLRNLVTRMYLPEEVANDADPVLQLVPEHRRPTLIAQTVAPGQLQWDIHLRGEQETVFFAW